MQWLLLSVKIQKMISVWWFANRVTYHIDAERNPTGSIVGRTPNNEGVCRLQTLKERCKRRDTSSNQPVPYSSTFRSSSAAPYRQP
ncbi:MAG TPA: hypothetical protein DCY04_02120 [Eubacterium sp.]|nr:hypothetical protein [Eubacterium sp.]